MLLPDFKAFLVKSWAEVQLLQDPELAMSALVEPLLERALFNLSEQDNDILTHTYVMFMIDKVLSN
jgi:hypothetical protein